ncbi:CGNR zinc finger domain-containing protein [Hamadaea tsunoensis]|uniref:CGNR zinc finger domain-containing protein n=1 Tax=Hamadaea tsunoensis TaxID=53368 RepID=UPI001B7FD005|nr:ABATE domain-containing protein [Hamadaea tsunoensis]
MIARAAAICEPAKMVREEVSPVVEVPADEAAHRAFRLDNEVLAFRFTATVSDRSGGTPRERLTDPARLSLWLRSAGLDVPGSSRQDLNDAVELREAIYRAGRAIATARDPDLQDVRVLNAAATAGQAKAVLEGDSLHWMLSRTAAVRDALGVLATDAVRVYGTSDRSRVKCCEGKDCMGLFLDTSRGTNRRWCSMNTCGNRAKKSRLTVR